MQAANKTKINLDGVILLDFGVDGVENEEGFVVPVVVSSEDLGEPILGYNVGESGQSGTMSRPQDFLDYLYRKAISDGLLCTIIVY